MPVKQITIVVEPDPKSELPQVPRVLMYERATKQWTSKEGGIFPGELALIVAIDKARQTNPV